MKSGFRAAEAVKKNTALDPRTGTHGYIEDSGGIWSILVLLAADEQAAVNSI